MAIKKILTALTLLFLITTLFVGAVSAITLFPNTDLREQAPTINAGDVLTLITSPYTTIRIEENTEGEIYFRDSGLVAGTYTKSSGNTIYYYTISYPDVNLKINRNGTTTNMNGKSVSTRSALDIVATPIVDGYDLDYLKFTTPTGSETSYLGNKNSIGNTSNNVFYTGVLKDNNVALGTWKVRAVVKGDFIDGKNNERGKIEHSFSVVTTVESISLDRDAVTRGWSFIVTLVGYPKDTVDIIINSKGLYPHEGQGAVNYTSSEKWQDSDSYKKVSVVISSSGLTQIQFDTKMDTNPQTFHLTAKFSEGDKSTSITVKRGYVEINSDFNSYYKGNAIKVSGTNTESKSVYLYIKGPDNKLKEILLDNGEYLGYINVNSDLRWSKEFKLSDSFANGKYIIYASSNPYEYTADGKPYVTVNENFAYSTDTFEIKNPSLSSSLSVNKDNVEISGTTEDVVGIVSYYIVGQSIFQWGSINVGSDGSISKIIDTTDFTIGKYSVIIQNPSYDKLFNVKAGVDNYDNEVTNYYNTVSSFATDEYGFLITPANDVVSSINTLSTQNAVDAICGLINKDYVDDIYKVVNFDLSNSKIISGTDSISIKQGWNFISIPKTLDPSKNNASIVFEGIDTDNNSIQSYNSQTKSWKPLEENTQIEPLTGYWIYSKIDDSIKLTYKSDPTSPPTKSVYKGWNAVGLGEEKSTPAQNVLDGTDWVKVRQWNIENKKYETAITRNGIGESSPDQLIYLKNGYWLYVNSDGTLT